VLTEASGLRIKSTDGVFRLEVEKSVVMADPEITRYLKVISYGVEIIEEFTLFLDQPVDCSDQVISLAGEATSAITRELGKNNGLVTLLTAETTAGFFEVSREEIDCAIVVYEIYIASDTKIASSDTDLYARFDVANY